MNQNFPHSHVNFLAYILERYKSLQSMKFILKQQPSTFLAPVTWFVENNFFHRPVWREWFWDDSNALHLLCTLFLLLLHRPHLNNQGLRTPGLKRPRTSRATMYLTESDVNSLRKNPRYSQSSKS